MAMPLWKLQTVGSEWLNFLYDNLDHGNSIVLQPGVAFSFRKFYWLIGDMVRGAWVRYVRRFNPTTLGMTTDLQEFLLGSERTPLKDLVPILTDIQKGNCFYCGSRMKGESVHFDHFIPWSRYPIDLGYNFVLAHARPCNAKKSDRIAAVEHLDSWVKRNVELGKTLAAEFDRLQIIHDLPTSFKVGVFSNRKLWWFDVAEG
jgi:HNH endonuclease